MLMRAGTQDRHPAMTVERNDLLDACLRLPGHVVHRTFVAETVLLNLQTGTYHGLNPVGGVMLDAVNQAPSVRDAVESVAEKYGEDPARVEADLVELCHGLVDRGLMAAVETSPEE
jgi:Coenzyme PQQ synthesis protein D (PqqD)